MYQIRIRQGTITSKAREVMTKMGKEREKAKREWEDKKEREERKREEKKRDYHRQYNNVATLDHV